MLGYALWPAEMLSLQSTLAPSLADPSRWSGPMTRPDRAASGRTGAGSSAGRLCAAVIPNPQAGKTSHPLVPANPGANQPPEFRRSRLHPCQPMRLPPSRFPSATVAPLPTYAPTSLPTPAPEQRVVELEWRQACAWGDSDIIRLALVPEGSSYSLEAEFPEHTLQTQSVPVARPAGTWSRPWRPWMASGSRFHPPPARKPSFTWANRSPGADGGGARRRPAAPFRDPHPALDALPRR